MTSRMVYSSDSFIWITSQVETFDSIKVENDGKIDGKCSYGVQIGVIINDITIKSWLKLGHKWARNLLKYICETYSSYSENIQKTEISYSHICSFILEVWKYFGRFGNSNGEPKELKAAMANKVCIHIYMEIYHIYTASDESCDTFYRLILGIYIKQKYIKYISFRRTLKSDQDSNFLVVDRAAPRRNRRLDSVSHRVYQITKMLDRDCIPNVAHSFPPFVNRGSFLGGKQFLDVRPQILDRWEIRRAQRPIHDFDLVKF